MSRALTAAAALAALLGLAACSGYDNNDLELVTSYTAKDLCSCLFVMRQSEAYCDAWVKASPEVAVLRADLEARSVESAAGLFWGARAYHESDRFGCLLEE